MNGAKSTTLRNECRFCKKEIDEETVLEIHLKSHKKLWRYSCDVCNEPFPTLLSVAVHKRGHRKPPQFKCSVCPKTFNHYSNWRFHHKTHYIFKEGQRSFLDKKGYSSRKILSLQNVRKSKSESGLRSENHLKLLRCVSSPALLRTTMVKSQELFRCKKCKKSLSSWLELTIHCKSHSLEKAHIFLRSLSPIKARSPR